MVVDRSALGPRVRRLERILGAEQPRPATIVLALLDSQELHGAVGDRLNDSFVVTMIRGTVRRLAEDLERLRSDPRYHGR